MRIVLLISSLGAGGAERVATTLCNAWAARGDSVTLIPTFSGGGEPFYDVSNEVEVIYLADVVGVRNKTFWGYVKRVLALRRLMAERSPDVVISFLPNVNIAAIISTAFLKVPLIICERIDPSSFPISKAWKLACKLSYRFADMLTVQTVDLEKRVGDYFPGLRKINCVPNPLPSAIGRFVYHPGHQRKVLLFMGRLEDQKQVDRAVNAFSTLSSRFFEWDLHIYGAGTLRDSLGLQAESLGLADRVFIKGRTSEPWFVMSSADVFVMTSKAEGFPNVLLEAMAIGLPCVVYDCPSGPAEITRNGKDALLVPLNDQRELITALGRVMGDENLRKSLGHQARESVLERYSLSAVIGRWDELFREVGATS